MSPESTGAESRRGSHRSSRITDPAIICGLRAKRFVEGIRLRIQVARAAGIIGRRSQPVDGEFPFPSRQKPIQCIQLLCGGVI